MMRHQSTMRDSGMDAVGELPWGSHFCHFYRDRQSLVDTLVPYIRTGLEAGEYCVWVASAPLDRDEAEEELRRVTPDVDAYIESGQLELFAHDRWYPTGRFDSAQVLDQWRRKYDAAMDRGYPGMRLTGNTMWLERHGWEDFLQYEREVNDSFGEMRVVGLCTYSLDCCCASDVLDVVRAHQFAVFHDQGQQRMLHSDALAAAHRDLIEANERLRELARQLCTAESRERRRLAHVLHEDLQQVMAAAKMQVEVARRRAQPDAFSMLDRAGHILAEAIELTRGIATEMSPPLLHTAAFGAALIGLSRHYEQRFELRVALDLGPGLGASVDESSDFMFAAVRELLFNVVKHAGVLEATVRARRTNSGALKVVVEDAGRGCDPRAVLQGGAGSGFGLASIRQRLEVLGGRLSIDATPGRGCRVTLIAPVP